MSKVKMQSISSAILAYFAGDRSHAGHVIRPACATMCLIAGSPINRLGIQKRNLKKTVAGRGVQLPAVQYFSKH